MSFAPKRSVGRGRLLDLIVKWRDMAEGLRLAVEESEAGSAEKASALQLAEALDGCAADLTRVVARMDR